MRIGIEDIDALRTHQPEEGDQRQPDQRRWIVALDTIEERDAKSFRLDRTRTIVRGLNRAARHCPKLGDGGIAGARFSNGDAIGVGNLVRADDESVRKPGRDGVCLGDGQAHSGFGRCLGR